MSLLERLRPHWRPLSASALLLGLGLLAALLHAHSNLQSRGEQLDLYGQALARSTAQRAVDATLSQDMISLQAALRELTRHPQVVGATIHDVENQLLVQSGFAPADAEPGQYRRYSATVALDSTIAGHLQMAVEPPSLTGSDLQFYLWWLPIILAAALLPWLPSLRQHSTSPPAPSTTESPTESVAAEELIEPASILRLRLHLANLAQLYQQLNRESFDRQLVRFERQLRNVLSLYGGERIALSDETLIVDFKGESQSDCAFRALCSAQLLGELTHLNPGPRLVLRARIHSLPEPKGNPPSLSEEFVLQHQQPMRPPGEKETGHQGIEIDPALIDAPLERHLELDRQTGVLIGVKAPYRQLLDKQQQQLQAVSA